MKACALLAVILAASCGGESDATAPTTTRTPEQAHLDEFGYASESPELDWSACTIYREGSAIQVTFSGEGAEIMCDDALREWSGDGAFWRRAYEPRRDLQLICQMTNGVVLAAIEEAEDVIFDQGDGLCGEFVASGWNEPTG